MRTRLLMLLLIAAAIPLQAATIRVPQDQPTIQAGIDAAVNGDTVLVAPGGYQENIKFNGKAVIVRAIGGRDLTSITQSTPGVPIIRFTSSEDTNSVLDGFTITNSIGAWGVAISHASPTIQNCDVSFCSWNGDGGAIHFEFSSAIIRRNRIHDNIGLGSDSPHTGGGIGGAGWNPLPVVIAENQIFNNWARNGSGIGITPGNANVRIEDNSIWNNFGDSYVAAGIYINQCTGCYIVNNTIVGNSRGVCMFNATDVAFLNNIIAFNSMEALFPTITQIDYCDIWANGTDASPGPNGQTADPIFLDTSSGDLRLTINSPCIDAGNPDSIFNDTDGSRNDIGAYPLSSLLLITNLEICSGDDTYNVVSANPLICWRYQDYDSSGQIAFEMEVGHDLDWLEPEMWSTGQVTSPDTSLSYGGAPLMDGETYFLRLRIRNGTIWSNWSELSFRMNSVPTLPQLRLPENNSIVASQFPDLTIRNPIDAESDSMLLTFEISTDSFAISFFPFQAAPSTDSLTAVAVPVLLDENTRYWWRVKSSDYYEESGYSPIWSFWINSSNTAPSAFSLLSPPNALSPTLPDNTPEFTWQSSFDLDPGDSVKFTLLLSIDSTFSFASQIPNLLDPQYVPTNPLEWGRRYWWRVKAEDHSTGLTWSNEVFSFATMRLGDPDGNGIVTISDAVFLINYIFSGGPAPNPIESGDVDCNGFVTISDAVYLINYIFASGPAPCEM